MLAKLVIWLLRRNKFKGEDKARVINSLLENIDALPIADIISFDLQGTILVKGKPLEPEQAMSIREGAVALNRNQARKLIREQIAFEAIKMGVHSSLNLDMVLFSKAALWLQQQEDRIIKDLVKDVE